MKVSFFYILLAFMVASCSAPRQGLKSEDTSRALKSIEMADRMSAYPLGTEKKSSKNRVKLKAIHRFEVENEGKASLSIEFLPNKLRSVSKSDSTIEMVLNNEKISISRISDSKFSIPENLWVPIANCSKIEYLIYIGTEEFEVLPDKIQVKELNYFFERAIQARDASLPAIPPGLKKW